MSWFGKSPIPAAIAALNKRSRQGGLFEVWSQVCSCVMFVSPAVFQKCFLLQYLQSSESIGFALWIWDYLYQIGRYKLYLKLLVFWRPMHSEWQFYWLTVFVLAVWVKCGIVCARVHSLVSCLKIIWDIKWLLYFVTVDGNVCLWPMCCWWVSVCMCLHVCCSVGEGDTIHTLQWQDNRSCSSHNNDENVIYHVALVFMSKSSAD